MQNPATSVLRRELERIVCDPVYLFMWIIAPLIGFSLVIMVFSASVPRQLPVAVVDLDHTPLSRKITRTIGASPAAKPDSRYTSTEEARLAMISGETDAVVVIPKGTERSIMRGEAANIAVYLNNVYLIKGGLLKSGIQKALATLSAGIRLQMHMTRGEPVEQAKAGIQAVQLNPVLLFNPYTSYEYYLTLLILPVMLTVFILFGTIYALGTELQYGTGPEWLKASGNRMSLAMTGKLLPHFTVYVAIAMVMNLLFFRFLGLPLRGRYLLIVVSEVMMILSYQFMAVFIVTLTRNLRLALSLASAYTMLAITFAGLTFPSFGMPAIARVFGKIFPFTYWLNLFIGQTLRGEPLIHGIRQILPMILFILAGLCTIPRLKYHLTNRKSQGKI